MKLILLSLSIVSLSFSVRAEEIPTCRPPRAVCTVTPKCEGEHHRAWNIIYHVQIESGPAVVFVAKYDSLGGAQQLVKTIVTAGNCERLEYRAGDVPGFPNDCR